MGRGRPLSRPKNSIDLMVEKLGGPSTAARALGVSSQTISFWRLRRSMPTDTQEAKDRILLAERLTGIHRLELVGLSGELREKPSDSTRCRARTQGGGRARRQTAKVAELRRSRAQLELITRVAS